MIVETLDTGPSNAQIASMHLAPPSYREMASPTFKLATSPLLHSAFSPDEKDS